MKRGSALLVVLGMLSFMVISAVAFSIFMRQGRLPSSFLRQRILSRELVKAALAQAMSELDAAIGDAKYPGVGSTNGGDGDTGGDNRNYWRNRVFMGVQSGVTEQYGPYADDEAAQKATVSTMPLEGLAYLPPPLVNTVRYWSRHSPTAAWKYLDYDSGRWAYTAVNVSDYLDINRLRANVMRDSSPSNRISLAFLFENGNHTGMGEVSPKSFDQQMTTLNASTYGRLVSMADYNLALDQGGLLSGSGFKSPFCEFIRNPSGDGSFYGSSEEQARIQKFVTDSWYPSTNTAGSGMLFLTSAQAQPLENMSDTGLAPLMKNGSEGFNKIKDHLNLPERASLRDYIDEDNVPTSLALPTLERTPVLTGIQLKPMGFKPMIEEVGQPVTKTIDETHQDILRLWKLSGFEDPKIMVAGSALFPFKRSSGLSNGGSYEVQVLVRGYLVPDGTALTKTRSDVSWCPANAADWKSDVSTLGAQDRAFISLLGKGTATVNSSIKSESDALIDIQPFTCACNGAFERPLYGVVRHQVKNPETGLWSDDPANPQAFDGSRFGEVGGGAAFYCRNPDDGKITAVGDGMTLKWQFVAWVRIMDGNNTVDMFPARIRDDVTYNGVSGPGISTDLLGEQQKEPIVPFAGSLAFKQDVETYTSNSGNAGGDGMGETLSLYCNDPRFNWAPEDWFSVEGGAISSSDWYQRTKNYRQGGNNRPHDLFQFVSNQGYLQSMGEIQFLPMVRNTYGDFTVGSPIGTQFFNTGRYNGAPFVTSIGSLVNDTYMWKTRWGFGQDADWDKGGDEQDPYRWGIADTDGGVAINPYADEDLFMAALANTPYDYAVAAEQENEADKDFEANKQLCFNNHPGNSEAKLEWEKLELIAERMREKFKSGEEWEEWNDWENTDFFSSGLTRPGQGEEGLHDVDRKFLFSYWRQCFANNQQLFLIFVRAEPTVIGGSGAGHTPSQLGARAVALVWREPVSSLTAQNGERHPPHRMRVLFYHQFE